jgi:hypothetical protein
MIPMLVDNKLVDAKVPLKCYNDRAISANHGTGHCYNAALYNTCAQSRATIGHMLKKCAAKP